MTNKSCRIKAFLYEYRSGTLFLVFALLAMMFYELEGILVPRYWMVSPLDAHIPFLPVFVLPYLVWFPFIGVGLALLFFKDREAFVPTASLLCAGFAAALIIFILFPNGQHLRPRSAGAGPFAWLVQHLVYANDTNTNCCPSLHVMNQVAVYTGLRRSCLVEERPRLQKVLLLLTILVCASTVFIKQHSIEDVAIALILEYGLCRVFFPEPAAPVRAGVRRLTRVIEY